MKYVFFTLCLTGILSAGNLMAETLSLSCPAAITTAQQVKDLPAGWDSSIDVTSTSGEQGNRLESIGFYSGPPKEGALLAPDQTQKRGKNFTNVWDLLPAGEKYWFSCAYYQTALILSKQLPDQPMRCEAQYTDDSLVPVKLSCRTDETRLRRQN